MKTYFHNVVWFWLPPMAYMVAIFAVSAQSNPQIGGHTPDYVLHALEYFLLALLLIRLLLSRYDRENGSFARWQRYCLAGLLFAIVYGLSDEAHQYFTPGRHCSLHDVLADSFGAFWAYVAGCLDYVILGEKRAWLKRLKRWEPFTSISYAVARLK